MDDLSASPRQGVRTEMYWVAAARTTTRPPISTASDTRDSASVARANDKLSVRAGGSCHASLIGKKSTSTPPTHRPPDASRQWTTPSPQPYSANVPAPTARDGTEDDTPLRRQPDRSRRRSRSDHSGSGTTSCTVRSSTLKSIITAHIANPRADSPQSYRNTAPIQRLEDLREMIFCGGAYLFPEHPETELSNQRNQGGLTLVKCLVVMCPASRSCNCVFTGHSGKQCQKSGLANKLRQPFEEMASIYKFGRTTTMRKGPMESSATNGDTVELVVKRENACLIIFVMFQRKLYSETLIVRPDANLTLSKNF